MFGVPKNGKLVEGTNLPILRRILIAIPSRAFQRIIEADIRALPHHGQSSGIEVDQDDRAIVWSESDMTAAFYCFLLEPSLYHSFAINKTLPACPRNLILLLQMSLLFSRLFVSCSWAGRARAVSSNIFIDGCVFCPPLLGAGLDPSREIRRDMPLPRTMDKDAFSQAELLHVSELASAAEILKATAAVHAAWAHWGIPRAR